MVGVIVGDLTGGAAWMIVGALYYALTDKIPPHYFVLPAFG